MPSKDTHPDSDVGPPASLGIFIERGKASWYGAGFKGHKMANGGRYNMYAMTAAHPNLPLQTWVLVHNLRNNKTVILQVTDRGPYTGKRILDVSYAAAKQLDFIAKGTTEVEIYKLDNNHGKQLDSDIRLQ
ncbi:Rare lipoprotein A precursor [Collimonas arenae]|uniref:Endolytic peptidoglycan transglycosylase RlpA n=1 Tax=Collimonas arenae TaxID=279058 RepID=A0A0A1FB10_9BURK|nr:Rare lipoprotein A precursor [Collimonas arenae]